MKALIRNIQNKFFQLRNFHGRSALLQVFVAVEQGTPRPHPLFKICKVNNKTAAPAIVRELWDGIPVLEMAFSEKRDWTIEYVQPIVFQFTARITGYVTSWKYSYKRKKQLVIRCCVVADRLGCALDY